MKEIKLTGEQRKELVNYVTLKRNTLDAQKLEREAKAKIKALFETDANSFKAGEKSEYTQLAVRYKNETRHIVRVVTKKAGNVNWEAYARALGGTDTGAEKFRGDASISVKIDWATPKQEQEIAGE